LAASSLGALMFSNSRQNPVLDMSEQMRTTERSVSGAQLQRATERHTVRST